MKWLTILVLGIAAAGCIDFGGPERQTVQLNIYPTFDANGIFADNADLLRLRIQREDSTDAFTTIVDDTVSIDAQTGEVDVSVNVVLVQSPQNFKILLEAIRSSDGTVLFSGEQIVSVDAGSSSGSSGESVSIPVTYGGPRGDHLVIEPSVVGLNVGDAVQFTATVFDSLENVLDIPVTFFTGIEGDSSTLQVVRLTGLATALNDAIEEVLVIAQSADSLRDTARVFIGAVPVRIEVSPGFASAPVGGTTQLTGVLFDAADNPVGAVTWESRNTPVATVDAAGLVTGVADGEATLVATGQSFTDSVLVRITPAGHAVVFTSVGGLGFAQASAGSQVVVDVTVRMTETGEALGSYNATLTWDTALLQYVSFATGDFAGPVVNETNAAAGELRFGSADASGVSDDVVVIRVTFNAAGAGTVRPAVQLSELSAAQTFTDLINSFSVTNGYITVTP